MSVMDIWGWVPWGEGHAEERVPVSIVFSFPTILAQFLTKICALQYQKLDSSSRVVEQSGIECFVIYQSFALKNSICFVRCYIRDETCHVIGHIMSCYIISRHFHSVIGHIAQERLYHNMACYAGFVTRGLLCEAKHAQHLSLPCSTYPLLHGTSKHAVSAISLWG